MSAFLAGSPVVAKITATPVTKRDVTVRAAANADVTRRAAVAGVLAFFVAQPANASTKQVRAKQTKPVKFGASKPGTAPHGRTPYADSQAAVAKAYGLDKLPGQ